MPYYPSLLDKPGFWGATTSQADFCEDNYAVSKYICEFWNSLSNIAYVIFGFLIVKRFQQQGLPKRAQACGLALMFIGVCSTAFHATMKQATQGLDDISMMILVSICLFASLQNAPTLSSNSFLLASALIVLNAITISFDILQLDPTAGYVAFGTVVTASCARILYLFTAKPMVNSKQYLKLYAQGLAIFLLGFLIWNVDNLYCQQLRMWRAQLGMPLAVFLEGHAYWHILTGLGVYYLITAGCAMCLESGGWKASFTIRQDAFGLPVLIKHESKKA